MEEQGGATGTLGGLGLRGGVPRSPQPEPGKCQAKREVTQPQGGQAPGMG